MLLIAISMLFAGVSELMAFLEGIASSGGINTGSLGEIKAAGSLLMLIGPLIASILGSRVGIHALGGEVAVVGIAH